jgi:hypothetical protein
MDLGDIYPVKEVKMGFYVQGPTKGKADYLLQKYEEEISELKQEEAGIMIKDPRMGVLVAVENGPFDAVGFAFDEVEFEAFTLPDDFRPKRFLALSRERAEELSGYRETVVNQGVQEDSSLYTREEVNSLVQAAIADTLNMPRTCERCGFDPADSSLKHVQEAQDIANKEKERRGE